MGVLSWLVRDGHADGVDLAGLAAAFVIRYDDDEPGSPWSFVVHVDERGTEEQRGALSDIFLGERGGPHIVKLPWVRKPRKLVEVRPARVDIVEDGRALQVGDVGLIRVSRQANDGHAVACGIPGYERVGSEYYADEARVQDEPFDWQLEGNCAYATTFEYT